MKKAKLFISIPAPCPENWETMPLRGEGRFCAVCNHCVQDFRGKTDRELFEIFTRTTQPACGIFREDQLERNIIPAQQARISGWRLFALTFGALFVTNLAYAQRSKPANKNYASAIPLPSVGNYHTIEGIIRTAPSEFAANVTVQYKGQDGVLAVSDSSGHFTLNLPVPKKPKKVRTLIFTHPDYFTREIMLTQDAHQVIQFMMTPLVPPATKPGQAVTNSLPVKGLHNTFMGYVNGVKQLVAPELPSTTSKYEFKRKL